MAASTTWSPAPWLSEKTWLLTDNAVVKTPPLESSTSGRRVRIAGQTKSHASSTVSDVLRGAVKGIADKRDAKPWVMVETPDENLIYHGGAAPNFATTPDFTKEQKLHLTPGSTQGKRFQYTDIAFEFVSEECPTVTALVWVYMGLDSCDDNIFASSVTYRYMHEDAPVNGSYGGWFEGADWMNPFNYYDTTDDDAARAMVFLRDHKPIPGVGLYHRDYGKQDRLMVTDAIKLLRELMDVETIEIPVWRERRTPTLMKFKATGRTTWSNALYRQMLDHVQTGATVERIKTNMRQIVNDMQQLGITPADRSGNTFLQIVEETFAEDVPCHMIPLTKNDNDDEQAPGGHTFINVVPDHEHTVSLDLKSGTLVVNCLKDSAEVVEAWNFQRFQAELKGELDAFLGFARQQQHKRAKRRVSQIVKERSTDEEDLEITHFSA